MPTCTVYIRDEQGGRFATTTTGETLFENCAHAIRFFNDPFWKGPKPQPDSVLEVSIVGRKNTYRVKVRRVVEWLESKK